MSHPAQPAVRSRFDGPPVEALQEPQEQALQLLQKQLKPNELAYRRGLLRGATRFFGLDIHKEYVTFCAVDAGLNPVVRMTSLKWSRFPAWIEKNLTLEAPSQTPFTEKLRDWWLALPLSPVEHLTVRQGLETVAFSKAHITELEHIMARELLADERLPLLIQVPGIGLVGAMTILSAIGPIERFPSERHLVGYAGLGAKVHASGQRHTTGRITKTGRIDLRSTMVTAAHAAKRLNPHWKAEFQRLAARIGRNKATVAIARKLLCSVWHILQRREVDCYGDPAKIAQTFAAFIYRELDVADLPNGETVLECVRRLLDQLKIGKELQYVRYGNKRLVLPQSSQPGAAPVPTTRGHGQRQNTREAREARAAEAARKRAEVEARRVEAETRRGQPRKPRSDKGVKRGPNKLSRADISGV